MRRVLTAAALGGATVLLLVAPAAAASWHFETLDGGGGPNGRTTNAVGQHNAVLLYGGSPHVWYHDFNDGDLRHAWWDSGSAQWGFEILDGEGGPNGRTTDSVGSFNAVTLYGGAPHVWYESFFDGDLRHAWWDPGSAQWGFEILDGNGGPNGRTTDDVGDYNAVTLVAGVPHVWYQGGTNDLRHAWWDPGAAQWKFEILDGEGGPNGRTSNIVGQDNAVVLVGGSPHVWYQDQNLGDLRHAWWDPGTAQWGFETLDGQGGPDGRTTDNVGLFNTATVYQGTPHVWYYDNIDINTEGHLRHAWWDPGVGHWNFEILDGNGGPDGRTTNQVGQMPSVALYQGAPHVWYLDSTGADLRHAWWDAGAGHWSFETLDGQGGPDGRTTNSVGAFSAATLYPNEPHVWYLDGTPGELRHAWYG